MCWASLAVFSVILARTSRFRTLTGRNLQSCSSRVSPLLKASLARASLFWRSSSCPNGAPRSPLATSSDWETCGPSTKLSAPSSLRLPAEWLQVEQLRAHQNSVTYEYSFYSQCTTRTSNAGALLLHAYLYVMLYSFT